MDDHRQLITRVKVFINSSDLTDSPIAQDLYNQYLTLNNGVAKRLVECEAFLQKKQKIEAVVLAQQDPNIFDLIDSLFCPERKKILDLAELYEWRLPDVINIDVVSRIKKAVSEMDSLRPLLSEFRRIARTNQIKDKLLLLREISRMDKGNNEWDLSLVEVENQYLSQLIDQAQSSIQKKDFYRLEEIYEELHHSQWRVTIPTIVKQKIDALIEQYRKKENAKEAAKILKKINVAYATFETTALSDAFLCWDDHCKKTGYIPSKNEQTQLSEARQYLNDEKKKDEIQLRFQKLIECVTVLINSSAPLETVEKNYADAESLEQDIPIYISERVKKYRRDVEHKRKVAMFLKGCKIISSAAMIIIVLVAGIYFAVLYSIEREQTKNLQAAIKAKNIVKAQSLLHEIEVKHPRLASSPKISRERTNLRALETKENNRVKVLKEIISEIVSLQDKRPLDTEMLKKKIDEAKKIVQTELEKQQLQLLSDGVRKLTYKLKSESEKKYKESIAQLRKSRENALNLIRQENFEEATKELHHITNIIKSIKAITMISKELTLANKNLLNSEEEVQQLLDTKRDVMEQINSARRSLIHSNDLANLAHSCISYKQITEEAKDEEHLAECKILMDDIDALERTNRHLANLVAKMEKDCADAKTRLINIFDELQKNINNHRLYCILFKYPSSKKHGSKKLRKSAKRCRTVVDIFFTKNLGRIGDQFIIYRNDGAKITVKQSGYSTYELSVDEDRPVTCELFYPKDICYAQAVHQKLIKDLFKSEGKINEHKILEDVGNKLYKIISNPYCSPYWKMQLSLRILQVVASLDKSPDKIFLNLKHDLEEIKKLDDRSGNPLYNKFLKDKINLFFDSFDDRFGLDILNKIASWNTLYQNASKYSFQYLGIAMEIDGKIKYAMNKSLKLTSGDILCFDDSRKHCLIVGRFENGIISLNSSYYQKAIGRLLFTTNPVGDIKQHYRHLRNELGNSTRQIDWPEFWPVNLRGDEND